MIELYGSAKSRASRSLLALEELGLRYEHAPLRPWAKPADRAALAAINPNDRVAVLSDGELVLWKSCQWSVWSQTEIDVLARNKARYGDDAARKRQAEAERMGAVTRLNAALAGRPYLVTAIIFEGGFELAPNAQAPAHAVACTTRRWTRSGPRRLTARPGKLRGRGAQASGRSSIASTRSG
jgi:hypothetical protein